MNKAVFVKVMAEVTSDRIFGSETQMRFDQQLMKLHSLQIELLKTPDSAKVLKALEGVATLICLEGEALNEITKMDYGFVFFEHIPDYVNDPFSRDSFIHELEELWIEAQKERAAEHRLSA